MKAFFSDAFNYVLHFILVYLILATIIGMVLMVVGLAIGITLDVVFGVEGITDSPELMGGAVVGVSIAFLASLVFAVYFTIKVAPTERNREKFFMRTARTLGRPNLAYEMGYGEQAEQEKKRQKEEEDDDDDSDDWWLKAGTRNQPR